jgi:hypothetical protein
MKKKNLAEYEKSSWNPDLVGLKKTETHPTLIYTNQLSYAN